MFFEKMVSSSPGGVLYSKNALEIKSEVYDDAPEIKMAAMLMKHLCIERGMECSRMYRRIFAEDTRELNENCKIRNLPPFSEYILRRSSVGNIVKKRKENYRMLSRAAGRHVSFLPAVEFLKEEVPFVYPVFARDRDRLRRFLTEERVYCAIHWPLEDERQRKSVCNKERMEHMISLPLDQRYGREHMNYLLEVLEKWDRTYRESKKRI